MKIRELCELLKGLDPDADVVILDAARMLHQPAVVPLQGWSVEQPGVLEIKPDYMADDYSAKLC